MKQKRKKIRKRNTGKFIFIIIGKRKKGKARAAKGVLTQKNTAGRRVAPPGLLFRRPRVSAPVRAAPLCTPHAGRAAAHCQCTGRRAGFAPCFLLFARRLLHFLQKGI